MPIAQIFRSGTVFIGSDPNARTTGNAIPANTVRRAVVSIDGFLKCP